MQFTTLAIASFGLFSAVLAAPAPAPAAAAEANEISARAERSVTVWEHEKFQGRSSSWNAPEMFNGCLNLPQALRGQVSSFKVRSADCQFFERSNCQGFLFGARDREDETMHKSGKLSF